MTVIFPSGVFAISARTMSGTPIAGTGGFFANPIASGSATAATATEAPAITGARDAGGSHSLNARATESAARTSAAVSTTAQNGQIVPIAACTTSSPAATIPPNTPAIA